MLVGKALRPWQRQVADVAMEIDPATGRLAYREVVLTVPRQQGKSTLLLALMVQRALGFAAIEGRRQVMTYAAQNGVAAREKFLEDYAEEIEASPLKDAVSIIKANGREGMRFPNGSRCKISASTEKAGHGKTLDLAFIDEAFAYVDARLEQAFGPAQQAVDQPQTWVVSTAGTAESLYLRSKVDAGRDMVDAGISDTTAYFEWSATEDEDPEDPETWWGCMPSLGHGIRPEAIAHELKKMKKRDGGMDEFCRAFLNQWRTGKTAEQVIDRQHWKACRDGALQLDRTSRLTLAVDVSPSRNQAAIAVAGLSEHGSPGIEVIDTDEGTEWIVPALRKLKTSVSPAVLALDGAGPAASLIPDLIEDGWQVATSTEVTRDGAHGQLVTAARGDVVAACGQLYDVAVARRLRHRDQPVLNAALAGAAKRPVGDAWAWGRRQSAADITPLMAGTVALWAHTRFVRAGLQPVDPLSTVF